MRGTSKAPPAKVRPKPMVLKRLRRRIGIPVTLMAAALLVLALPAGASAFLALGDQKEFFAPTQPTNPLTLAEGPDGNVWYTNDGSTKIGKVTPAGVVTEYSPGLTGAAFGITAGPEGTVWFTERGSKKIGYIKTSEPTTSLKEFPEVGTLAGEPEHITEGPDGNLWFTYQPEGATKVIGKITPAGVIEEFDQTDGLNASAAPCSIIPGPDGNVWFGDCNNSPRAVGKVTPAGVITEFPVTGNLQNEPHSITFGSDERIWFPANGTGTKRVGAITTAGVVTYYSAGSVNLNGFATGADGNVWARDTFWANEKQTLTIEAAAPDLGGTYKLSFKGDQTGPIAASASPATVEAALGALPSVGGVANVNVLEVSTTAGAATRGIEFEGKFARIPVEAIVCDGSGLTGTPPVSCTITDNAIQAQPQRLFRFETSGALETFPLEPQTLVQVAASVKTGTVVSGPDNSLWYTAMGDAAFPSTPAIGKFGLGIVNGPELTVTKDGTGDGTVVSNPAGIECGGECSAKLVDTGEKVTLTASPDSESLFVSWKGCEKGGANGRQCTVTMDVAKTVVAKFTKAYDVEVNSEGSGLGKVQSSPAGVVCLANCPSTSAMFKEGTPVTLTATPSKYHVFTEWTGDCSGVSPTCALGALGADKEVGAIFTPVTQFDLTLTKSGNGNGVVKAKQAGINCAATCTSQAAGYYSGTEVELTVTPGKGSSFGGWSTGAGTCTGATNPCKVTMSSAKSVTAEFK